MKHYSFYVKREIEGKGCQNSFTWNGARWLSEKVFDNCGSPYCYEFKTHRIPNRPHKTRPI